MTLGQIERRARWSADHLREVRAALLHCETLLQEHGRRQLAESLGEVRRRLGAELEMRVVLVGEFKSGKTALLNALVSEPLLPVSPIRTTTLPVVVRYGPRARYQALKANGPPVEISEVELRRLAVTPVPELDGVVQLNAELPDELLAAGLVLIDTPNLSAGMASPAGALVLGYARACGAVLLVSDASQELQAPQVELLDVLADLGDPVIIGALTKVDLYPDAARIQEVDRERLRRPGREAPVIPVSAQLHGEGLLLGDQSLVEESGIDRLRWYLAATLIPDVLQHQSRQSLQAAAALLSEAGASLERDLSVAGSEVDLSEIDRELTQLQLVGTTQLPNFERELRNRLRAVLDNRKARLATERNDAVKRVADLIDRGDPVRGWPAMHDAIVRVGTEAVASHLRSSDDELAAVIDATAAEHLVDAAALGLDRRPSRPSTPITGTLADLAPRRPGEGTRRWDMVRQLTGGALTASSASGIVVTLLANLGVASVPVAGPIVTVVSAFGMAAAYREQSSRKGRDEQAVVRHEARQAAQSYIDGLYRDLDQRLTVSRRDLEGWLEQNLQPARENLAQHTAEEIGRLTEARTASEAERRRRRRQLAQARRDLTTCAAQVARLTYTLERPEMGQVRR